MKKNTLISLAVSMGLAAFWAIVSQIHYDVRQGSLTVFVAMFLMLFALLMAVFAMSVIIYNGTAVNRSR